MRVVLDSSIIIAAFASRGLCSSLFELCIEKHEVIISEQILRIVSKNLEVRGCLGRVSMKLLHTLLNFAHC